MHEGGWSVAWAGPQLTPYTRCISVFTIEADVLILSGL